MSAEELSEETPEGSPEESSGEERYTGPERRKGQRREIVDRRETVRFEPEKTPRRSGKDRRRSRQDLWEKRDI